MRTGGVRGETGGGHHRRLETAGIEGRLDVEDEGRGGDDERVVRGAQGLDVAAVGGEEEGPLEAVTAQGGDEVAQDRGEGRGLDVERAGEVEVLARAAEGDRGQRDRVADPRGEALGEGVGDPAIGAERQMRAVLLDRAEGHDRGATAGREPALDFGPDGVLEPRRVDWRGWRGWR
jgi:hypothetical protein